MITKPVRLVALLFPLLCLAHDATAESLCGPAPALPTTKEYADSVKRDLSGKADFLSKLVLRGELQGEIEAARKQIFQDSDKFFAAQKDAYLAYLFCVLVMDDKTLSTQNKINALNEFKRPIDAPQSNNNYNVERKNKLIDQYKEILYSINDTINTRDLLVIPALDNYIARPSQSAWASVVWNVRQLRQKIEKGITLAMDYDSKFFANRDALINFIGFIDEDTNRSRHQQSQQPEIFQQKFGGAIDGWAAQQPTLFAIDESKMPSVPRAIQWRAEFQEKSKTLKRELVDKI